VLFLTMELIEGNPLGDLIVKDGLPLTRILPLAIRLADAVSAAKLREPSPVEPAVSALPTAALTGEGRIVGTVAYKSAHTLVSRTSSPSCSKARLCAARSGTERCRSRRRSSTRLRSATGGQNRGPSHARPP
jgi:hypothetical protein